MKENQTSTSASGAKTPRPQSSEFVSKSKRGALRILFGRTSVIILLLVVQFAGLFAIFAYFERYVSLAYGGFAVISLFMAVYITNSSDNPAIKLSWIVLIMLVPVFGTLLYFFVHKDIGHRLMYRQLEKVLEQTKPYIRPQASLSSELRELDRALDNTARYVGEHAGYPIYRNGETAYFPDGESFWQDLLVRLETAQRFIFLEYFIIEEGEMWGRILEILRRKAAEGVEVRVLYDGTCAVSLLPYGYPKTLAAMGIRCRMFAPLRPFVSTHYNNRDHRKILVIDGKIAYTGGVNLADEYVNLKNRFGHWKDCALRVEGEAVRSFTLMFLQIWNIAGGKENYESYLSAGAPAAEGQGGYILPYGDSPLDRERVGENMYMEILNTAKDYVYIMTPYLIIDNEMCTALQNAAKRGVDVRVILPGTPDHKMAFALAKTHYKELIPAGVRIYEYTPGFIHSKVFVSDDLKAVVGTINLDYRSLYLHFECAAYMYGVPAIADIRADCERTFAVSREIGVGDVKRQSAPARLYGGILKLLAPLM